MSRVKPSKVLSQHRLLLGNPLAYLNSEGGFDEPDQSQADGQKSDRPDYTNSRILYANPYAHVPEMFEDALDDEQTITGQSAVASPKPHPDVAQAVRKLHRTIWEHRNEIWPDGVPADPVDMLEPRIAAELIGFKFEEAEFLGDQTAGIIDCIAKRIQVSRRFPLAVRRFTGAHELGHAILHKQHRMHRDRPIDGTELRRDATEVEADKFATHFLMPEKLVKNYFSQVFGAIPFELNENTAYALDPRDPLALIRGCKSNRDLARLLAKAEYFNGKHVNSLAARFRVSVETMAIRLEELGLV